MHATELLATLKERSVRVWLDGDEIRCRGPRGALTPELRSRLGELRADVIRMLKDAVADRDERPLERVPRSGDLPLGFAQERLWFLQRMNSQSAAYNMTGVALLGAAFDKDALEASLQALVERQDALRTRFHERQGRPVAEISSSARFELDVVDLSGEPDVLAAEIEFGRKLASKPFSLDGGALLRAAVAAIGNAEHVLYFSAPHIVCDRWSMEILFSDFAEIYRARLDGRVPDLPALPFNYADFASWQRTHLSAERLKDLLAYWVEKLDGARTLLPLPLDRQRKPLQQHRAASTPLGLPPDASARVRQLATELRTTPYAILLGAFALTLARYASQDDVLIGSPIADRRFPELERVAGLFINTTVLRIAARSDVSVAEFFAAVHSTVLDAHAHQDLPFEKIVEELNPERSLSHPPIVQVAFSFQNTERTEQVQMLSGVAAKFDLTLFVQETDAGFAGAVEYSRELFDDVTIERFAAVFATVLEGLLADTRRSLRDVPTLPAAHVEQLVSGWNRTAMEYPRDSNVAAVFAAQVSATPDAIALIDGDVRFTYRELDAAAVALGERLRAAGVRERSFVAVEVERSHRLIVAVLAALKLGAAYVPLDPTYPPERRQMILRDSGARVLVAADAASSTYDGVTAVAAEVGTSGADHAVLPPLSIGGGDAAYVMFTSGSTGKPKGVCVPQRAILRLVLNTNYVKISRNDVFLQFAPASFDASTFEIWGALLNGACLVVAPPGPLSAAELGGIVRAAEVSILWLTAGMFHQVVDAGLEDFRSVRQWLAGGDVLSPAHVKKVLRVLPDCHLINGYGPTENTTFSCCHRIESPSDLADSPSVPIGRPIANTTAYVLDAEQKLVPIGVPGELCVGGDGLAVGYLGDEQLTEERFIAHPFAGAAERLYRTGDIVRYRLDGVLEFIGRRDSQIKVRGFRIELGEVEAALKSHPGVAEAVVAVRGATGAEKALAAYYQTRAGQVVSAQELRRHLQQMLPQYMVPGSIDAVESFVLGPTGKVDRKALPVTGAVAEPGGGALRPLTSLENQLIAIWEQVLNVRLIKVTDNFFDLGGTSLMAVQLFSQLKQVFGKDLPLATLFQAPTVEQLAKIMETEGWQSPWKSLVAIQPGGSKTPIFMVPGVGGNVLGFAHLANLLGSDQPFYGCQSRGLDGREPPFRRIEDMAAAYLKEIREVQPTGPYQIAGSCMGGVVAYEMAQQLKQAGEEVSALVMIETWLPVSLRRRYYRAFTFFKPGLFIAQGVWRHMASIARRGPRGWWSGVRRMVGIGLDMLRQRDVYRGDNQIQYQDVVSAANFRAMASYVPRKYPGYLHFFLASERPVNRRFDTRMAWARLAEQGYSLDTVNVATSGEFYQHPHVDKLAERMRAVLDEAQAGEGSS